MAGTSLDSHWPGWGPDLTFCPSALNQFKLNQLLNLIFFFLYSYELLKARSSPKHKRRSVSDYKPICVLQTWHKFHFCDVSPDVYMRVSHYLKYRPHDGMFYSSAYAWYPTRN